MNIFTAGLTGVESRRVSIDANATDGPESLTIVGLSDAAARESRIRVQSSLHAIGVAIDRAVWVRVEGADGLAASAFDLAVACAVLVALEKMPETKLADTLILGELSLSGELRPGRGVLAHLRQTNLAEAIVPAANHNAARLSGKRPYVAASLREVVDFLNGKISLSTAHPPKPKTEQSQPANTEIDIRADEIIASGYRRILLAGPPGSKKMALARAIAKRLPALDRREAVETAEISDAAGILAEDMNEVRPFRAPHHSVSEAGLVGGGSPARPGEVSLATHGTLLLDELPEFRASTLDSLYRALKAGRVTFRANETTTAIDARPACVIGTMARCACGYHGSALKTCTCTPAQRERYNERMKKLTQIFDVTLEVA